MRRTFEGFGVAAIAATIWRGSFAAQAQTIAPQAVQSLKTPWGEPDLDGIWTRTFDVPLQRPAKYAGREFFTPEEMAEVDKVRAARTRLDTRADRGTEQDVAGAYNAVFTIQRPTGRRTSLIVDPPDGRMPPVTPEVTKRRSEIREYQLALLENTSACKNKWPGCEGGEYTGKPSPRRYEPVKYYTGMGGNRPDGPENFGLGNRCMA